MGYIEKLLLASLLLGVYFYSVTGITMTVTPSSSVFVEGQIVEIQCNESSLPNRILLIELYRNNQRMVSYSSGPNQPTWDTSYTGPSYRTRANVTGSVTDSAASLTFVLNGTQCADSAVFHCKVISAGDNPATPSHNITIYGVLQSPTMNGGQECNIIDDPDCDKCTPDDPSAPRPKYIRRGEMLELVCAGQVGLPVSASTYNWYKKNDRDPVRVRIPSNNITTVIDIPTTSCSTTGRSTLRYYHTELDAGLVLTCEVTYDNTNITEGGVVTMVANTSVCIEGLVFGSTSSRPFTDSPSGTGHVSMKIQSHKGLAHLVFITLIAYYWHG